MEESQSYNNPAFTEFETNADKADVLYGEDHETKRFENDEGEDETSAKSKWSRWLELALTVVLILVYFAYFIAVLIIDTGLEDERYWCDADGMVIIITSFGVVGVLYFKVIKGIFGKQLNRACVVPLSNAFDKQWDKRWIRWSLYVLLVSALVVFLVLDTKDDRRRLTALTGIFVLIVFGAIFSKNTRKIRWRHIVWGISLQFLFGLMVLRWPTGEAIIECLADKVTTFLNFTNEGSYFVFGHLVIPDSIFAFTVLTVTLFFSFITQILFYYGILQWLVSKLGWLLQKTVGTTPCESTVAAANMFLGQTEAPLVIRPYVMLLTKSELHSIMTSGFGSIAGGVLAAYISMGIPAANLISATVMNAPGALAFSKLMYPETEVSRITGQSLHIDKGDQVNVLHAAMLGISIGIPLIANIGASLICYIAFIAFIDSLFDWSCTLVNIEEGQCTLENLFGYLFMPLAWTMGVIWEECHAVGTLIGVKTIINEFVAYTMLIQMTNDGTLSERSQVVATYALCGFSNISSIGIQLGGIGSMAPERRNDLAKIVVSALIAGCCTCFLTASIASLLLTEVD